MHCSALSHTALSFYYTLLKAVYTEHQLSAARLGTLFSLIMLRLGTPPYLGDFEVTLTPLLLFVSVKEPQK